MDYDKLSFKIAYLQELQQLKTLPGMDTDQNLADRIYRVMDSIDADLGTAKPFNVGELKVQVVVDKEWLSQMMDERIRRVLEGTKHVLQG